MYIFYVFNILATNAGLMKISLASSCVVYVTYLTFTLNISMLVHVSHLCLQINVVVFEIFVK